MVGYVAQGGLGLVLVHRRVVHDPTLSVWPGAAWGQGRP